MYISNDIYTYRDKMDHVCVCSSCGTDMIQVFPRCNAQTSIIKKKEEKKKGGGGIM